MANLNFYDTDAVKAFVLNILIENAELKAIWTTKRSVRTTGSTATRKPISK